MSKTEIVVLTDVALITVTVQRGMADDIVQAADADVTDSCLGAVVTFSALGFLVNINPAGLSLVIFTWVTGLGHLVFIQSWSYSTGILPTRQARRLFPVFAAAATLGAAAGGGARGGRRR